MLHGKCPKCGQFFFGWALVQARNQICANCNVSLLMEQERKRTTEIPAPFVPGKYQLQLPEKSTPGLWERDIL
jgi:hypothetical protein